MDLVKRIHQAKPSLILNIDNEYMTFQLMEQVKDYYESRGLQVPRRHYYHRFVKDFRQWTEKYIDFAHFTVPIVTGTADGYSFPGEFVGQYGVYEALHHIYSKTPSLKHLISDDSLYINREHFAADTEKAIDGIRKDFRHRHEID